MSYRASERVANLLAGKELSNMDVQLALKDSKRNTKLDERMAQITRMLKDNPSIQVKDRSFACYDPRYDSSVIQSLERLVYDATAENDRGANHGHPWWGHYHSALSARRFVRGLKADDKYQQAFRNNVADNISVPTTVGMLTRLGLPNKDLKQLLSSAIQPDGKLDWAFEKAISEVIARCKTHFIDEMKSGSPNSDMYEINPDGTVKLIPWTIEVMKREQSYHHLI